MSTSLRKKEGEEMDGQQHLQAVRNHAPPPLKVPEAGDARGSLCSLSPSMVAPSRSRTNPASLSLHASKAAPTWLLTRMKPTKGLPSAIFAAVEKKGKPFAGCLQGQFVGLETRVLRTAWKAGRRASSDAFVVV